MSLHLSYYKLRANISCLSISVTLRYSWPCVFLSGLCMLFCMSFVKNLCMTVSLSICPSKVLLISFISFLHSSEAKTFYGYVSALIYVWMSVRLSATLRDSFPVFVGLFVTYANKAKTFLVFVTHATFSPKGLI